MRTSFYLLLAVAVFMAPGQALAQLVTLDATNLIQNIQQVKQSVDQIKKLNDQVKNTKSQLEAMSGDRGMRRLVTDQTRAVIPKNWREQLVGSEANDVKRMVDGIRRDIGDIGNANLRNAPGRITSQLEKSARYDLDAWGRATKLYNTSNARFEKLDNLGNALDSATDMKAVLDLMARLQMETNMLLNEMLRMQAEMSATDRERTLLNEQRVQSEHAKALNSF